MNWKDDWDPIEPAPRHRLGAAGMGVLRFSLLFGIGGVALALFLTPMLDGQTRMAQAAYSPGIDFTTTSSINPAANSNYVIRRSVLQSSPDAICVIRPDGSMGGDC